MVLKLLVFPTVKEPAFTGTGDRLLTLFFWSPTTSVSVARCRKLFFFLLDFFVLYSTQLDPSIFRLCYVGGCWEWTHAELLQLWHWQSDVQQDLIHPQLELIDTPLDVRPFYPVLQYSMLFYMYMKTINYSRSKIQEKLFFSTNFQTGCANISTLAP